MAMLAEHAPVVTGLVAPDGTILALEGSLTVQLGYDPPTWVGRQVAEMIEDPTTLALLGRALAGETVVDTTVLNYRRWLVAMRPVLSGTGQVTGVVSLLTFADLVEVHHELTATGALNEQFGALIELS